MSLRARLLLALAYVLLLAIVALTVPLGLNVRDRVDNEVRSQARAQADVVAASARDALVAGDERALQELVTLAAGPSRGRVVVVDDAGVALADSGSAAAVGRSYRTRPEVAAALAGRATQDERRSDTLDADLLATAVPIVVEGRPAGAVRITQDVAARDRAVWNAWGGLALVGALVLGLGLLIGAVVAGQIARPVRRLERAAARVAAGDLDARAEVEGSAEQQALAREFNTMTERLGQLLGAQREFVADASHQLRTPLAGLRLRIEEARAETGDPAARAELDAALAEVDRLARIVADLLELSRAGERDAPAQDVDLGAAARRVAERWGVEASGSGRARCAPGDLDHVLDALVENALHYGAPPVRVVAHEGGIDVEDAGPGPAPGEEDAVFERFRRGAAGRAGPAGTGLGLPIARQLARRWGGDVTLGRRPGGGAVARVRLP